MYFFIFFVFFVLFVVALAIHIYMVVARVWLIMPTSW